MGDPIRGGVTLESDKAWPNACSREVESSPAITKAQVEATGYVEIDGSMRTLPQLLSGQHIPSPRP